MTIPMDINYAYALEIEAHTGSEVLKIYISSNPQLITKVTDTPPSKIFEGGLIQPGNYSISCFEDGKSFGKASIGYGEIVLNNNGGVYDYMLDYAFDGRSATLRRIEATLMNTAAYPNDWTMIFNGSLDRPSPNIQGYNEETIVIPWRDKMIELQIPLPLATYKGDNVLPDGLEGTADDLKDKMKQLVLGQVFQVSVQWVNTYKLICSVSAPSPGKQDLITDWAGITDFAGITNFFGLTLEGAFKDGWGMNRSGINNVSVFDCGIVIEQEDEYTSIEEMMENQPSEGKCRIYRKEGYIRFGSQPTLVTVSCMDMSGWQSTIGSMVHAIIAGYLSWPLDRYSLDDMRDVDELADDPLGILIQDDSETAMQILDKLCQSPGCCYYFDNTGKFRIFQIREPSTLPIDFTLTNNQIESLEFQNTEDIPVRGVRLKYQKCYTVQKTGLATLTTPYYRSFITNEWRTVLKENIVTKQKHRLSKIMEVETYFVQDVSDEAQRKCNLFSTRRDTINVKLISHTLDFTMLRLGMAAGIQFNSRFGYINKPMILIGITADLKDNSITLKFWG